MVKAHQEDLDYQTRVGMYGEAAASAEDTKRGQSRWIHNEVKLILEPRNIFVSFSLCILKMFFSQVMDMNCSEEFSCKFVWNYLNCFGLYKISPLLLSILCQTAEIICSLSGLTDKEITAQVLLFFLAGYDTTARALSMFLYNMALHPDIQEKLHAEIVAQIGDQVNIIYCRLSLAD